MTTLTKKEKKEKLEKHKRDMVLSIFNNKEDLYKWIQLFVGWKLTKDWIDKDSNSSPIDAIWEVYEAVKFNRGDVSPGFILLSSRDSYKTLSVSVLEVLLMVHFKCTVAHMAAIKSQSQKAISYINSLMRKLSPYLVDYHGWKSMSDNKSQIEYLSPEGKLCYIKVIICSLSGANSDHTNILCVDELDTIPNPKAFDEAKLIPGVESGQYPITVKLSTRKFAFGLMNTEIERAHISGDKILRWNILDTSEKCLPDRCRPDLPPIVRYVGRDLPLVSITEEEYSSLDVTRQPDFERVVAHSGCSSCILLPVCKTMLSKRGDDCVGGFYKPINAIINLFRTNAPDIAEAQLLCRKPSTKGLVYSRFDENLNTLTTDQAYNSLTGENRKNVTFAFLIETIKSLELLTYIGGDWGYNHFSAFITGCKVPNGDFWILDTFAQSELELDDLVRVGLELKEMYNVQKFFVDQAYPAYIATFKRKGMNCPKFTKDVMGGIQMVRGQICDSLGKRRLKVIKTDRNEMLLNGLKSHHFMLNAQGQLTQNPDDESWSDVMDALRYMGQNLFSAKGGAPAISKDPAPVTFDPSKQVEQHVVHNHQMSEEVKKLLGDSDTQVTETTRKSKGGLFWSM